MAEAARSSVEDARWWLDCRPHIRALRAALDSNTTNHKDVEAPLLKCVSLYTAHIRRNSLLDDEKVLIAVSGGDVTAMEASFMWLGGWRPTSALLLVYSLMGVQLEDEILKFRSGVRSDPAHPSAVLSEKQLINLTNVQKQTRGTEKKISKKLATLQMLVSDQDVIAAVMVESSTNRSSAKPVVNLKTLLKLRISRLKKHLIQADQLRLHTLHRLFLVLTPHQVARCATATFELAFSMRALGSESAQARKQAAPPTPAYTNHLPSPSRFIFQPDAAASSMSAPLPAGLSSTSSCSSYDENYSVAFPHPGSDM